MPISSKYKFQIFILLGLVLAVALAFFGIWPEIKETNLSLKTIQEQKIKIEEANNKKENLEKIKKDGGITKEINSKLENSLTSKDILNFVVKIEDTAKKTNVQQQLQIKEEKQTPVKTETPTEETGNEKIESQETGEEIALTKPTEVKNPLNAVSHLLMSIYLTGEFKNLLSYLIYFENISYQTDIDTLTINLQGAGIETLPGNLPTPSEKITDGKEITATLETKIFTNE